MFIGFIRMDSLYRVGRVHKVCRVQTKISRIYRKGFMGFVGLIIGFCRISWGLQVLG